MKYVGRRDRAKQNIYAKAKRLTTRFTNLTTALVLAVTGLGGGLLPLLDSGTAHAVSPAGSVWITAAMPDPTSGQPEYVTIKNVSSGTVNIDNWKVNAGVDHSVGNVASLGSGATMTFCDANSLTYNDPCDSSGNLIGGLGLDNSGDTITLKDDSGNVIDQVSYSSSTQGSAVNFNYHMGQTLNINNPTDLRNAIENQKDGQTWNIATGKYAVTQNNIVKAGCDVGGSGVNAEYCGTGWYLPVVASDITINGAGQSQTTLYGSGFTKNENENTQDFIAIFGNNVKIENMTIMPKIEPNKTIQVLGNNSSIQNVTISHNTLTDQSEYNETMRSLTNEEAKQWNGVIFYGDTHIQPAGTNNLTNVTINNGGVSTHYEPDATFNINNVQLNYSTNIDRINDYGFYVPSSNTPTLNGTPNINWHVSSTLNNLDQVMVGVNDATIHGNKKVLLDSDITPSSNVTIKQPMNFDGQNHTVSVSGTGQAFDVKAAGVTFENANITKTDDNNQVLIYVNYGADDVTINNVDFLGTILPR